MKEKVKELRVYLDACVQLCTKTPQKSGEITLAWRNLQMAKGWLGKLLAEIGNEPSPYTPADEIKNIPPTADVAGKLPIPPADHLGYINYMRDRLKEGCIDCDNLYSLVLKFGPYSKRTSDYCVDNTHRHIEEASMCLGLELARLRDMGQ